MSEAREHLGEVLKLTDPTRRLRGLFDGVGTGIQWLFGTATTADIERISSRLDGVAGSQDGIIHLMQHQTSVVNETLWEVREIESLVGNLTMKYDKLGKQVQRLYQGLHQVEETVYILLEVEEVYNAIDAEIAAWFRDISDLEVGLTALAAGRLPQSLFPPRQLRKVMSHVLDGLPAGWSLTVNKKGAEGLWSVYQEAEVSTMVRNGRLVVSIRLHVFETLNRFTLYRVDSLTIPTTDQRGATRIVNLPPFLALATDAFVELTAEEAAVCLRQKAPWCKIHTAVGKVEATSSCAWALFREQEKAVARDCKVRVSSWPGTQAIYLGKRRWALSALTNQTVEVSCPTEERHVISVPALGIFELPAGCSARTREWIFPASIEGAVSVSMTKEARTLPPLAVSRAFETHSSDSVVVEGEKSERQGLDELANLIRRTSGALGENDLTAVQARDLLDAEKTRPYSHGYPFEWIICFVFLLGILAWEKWRIGVASRARETMLKSELDTQRMAELAELAAIHARLAACDHWRSTHDAVLAGLPERATAADI